MKPSNGQVYNSLVVGRPKVLLIAPHNNITEPFRAALEKNGFAATVTDSSPSQSRAPHTEHFALVVNLRQNGRHETSGVPIGSHLIEATFLSPNRVFPGSIQLFRNGVYRLDADQAEIDKFIDTVRELCGEKNSLASATSRSIADIAHRRDNQQRASSIQSKRSGDPDPAGQPALIGQSPQIDEVRELIKCFSQFAGMPVLITGETGAGKEVVANLLHHSSPRADKPLIKINCSAIPDALFESQLFGHRKGAFTGAMANHPGYVGQAQDGTLFLDELSTLTLAQQAKLLRFLHDGSYIPVGETVERRGNAWIIAASNQSLKELMDKNLFRPDLYFRLNVAEINLPPLRERGNDILLFAEYFLMQFAQQFGTPPKSLSAEAREALLKYQWSGNVRELKNVIQKAVVYGQENIIRPEHLALETVDAPVGHISHATSKALWEVERDHIIAVFISSGRKIRKTALVLGIDRKTLKKKLSEYGIQS